MSDQSQEEPPVEWVTLTQSELLQAAMAGVLRHFSASTNNRAEILSEKKDNFNTSLARHLNGAAGEMAVAKLCGKYWGGHVGQFKGPDIGKGVQVRTRPLHSWQLLVRDSDSSDHAFVLVTGIAPGPFAVRGWIWGRDAKNPEWKQDKGDYGAPAYFPPNKALRPIIKLKDEDVRAGEYEDVA